MPTEQPQLRETLGKRIRRLRKERGLSQIALSDIAGVTKDQLESLQIVVSILEPESEAEQLALLKEYQGR